jgi:hypothetical protein
MKTHEILNNISNRITKHPDYKKAMLSYYQIEMVNDRYARATDEYYPGKSSVGREEHDKYYNLIKGSSNRSIFYIELMKSLLTEAERKDDYQACIDIFRKSIILLKKQLSIYEGFDRIRFAHDIFCFMEIPYANLNEYDPEEFLSKIFGVHVKKMKNMKRQQVQNGLREYFYGAISKLDPKVFSDDEMLPAAIILDAYQNNDMKGMKNARYFSTVVANELGEIIGDDTTAEIVRKLISHDHINGEIDGKYHFLIRD